MMLDPPLVYGPVIRVSGRCALTLRGNYLVYVGLKIESYLCGGSVW